MVGNKLYNSSKDAQLVKVPHLVRKVPVLKSLKQELLDSKDLRCEGFSQVHSKGKSLHRQGSKLPNRGNRNLNKLRPLPNQGSNSLIKLSSRSATSQLLHHPSSSPSLLSYLYS